MDHRHRYRRQCLQARRLFRLMQGHFFQRFPAELPSRYFFHQFSSRVIDRTFSVFPVFHVAGEWHAKPLVLALQFTPRAVKSRGSGERKSPNGKEAPVWIPGDEYLPLKPANFCRSERILSMQASRANLFAFIRGKCIIDLRAYPRSLLFFCRWLCLSVCPSVRLSVCHKHCFCFCFSMESSSFLPISSPWQTLQTFFFDFWFRPPNAQTLLPKVCTKSPTLWYGIPLTAIRSFTFFTSRLVWQIDRRCLGPWGFRG